MGKYQLAIRCQCRGVLNVLKGSSILVQLVMRARKAYVCFDGVLIYGDRALKVGAGQGVLMGQYLYLAQ